MDVDSAANSLRDSVAAIRAVIDSDDTPEYVADYFRGMLEGIGPQINEWDFEDAIESKFSSAFKNLDLDANDIYEALLGDGTDAVDQKIRDLIQNVAEVASETDIIPELIDGQDIPVESLEKLLDVLIELGYVEGATSNATQELANSFASVSESVQAAISEVETVNEVLSAQGTGTGVTLENFEALIAANKEYADALEYNNGVMKINAERAREIADQDVSASIAEASTEMKVQASTLRDTQDALLGYKEQLAKLYRD